jgi:anti-sigma regulatory factor (Ser/Thr protein kinase)
LGVIELAGTPESVKLAREFVSEKLGADHPALFNVTLLVSEAVTNSIVHSASRNGGQVTLTLDECDSYIHVDVADAGGESVPEVHEDLFAEGGRGMMLIDMLSQEWVVQDHDNGRTLSFRVAHTRTGEGAVPFCP